MDRQVLKTQWERYREHVALERGVIEELVRPTIAEHIDTISLLGEGCANTNYKITFKKHKPVVLRIYTRESSSLGREYELHQMVQAKVPVARILSVDESKKYLDYPFAILSYIDGILMRDVILTGDEKAIRESCLDAGKHLATLSTIKFEKGGFFLPGQKVRPFKPEEQYFNYCMAQINDQNVMKDLGADLCAKLHKLVLQNHERYLPASDNANLTHGDFDPANIKVLKTDGEWHVTGILDWEFAFAGSYFLDVGMMLRYSHKLPICYEESFILGMREHGCDLPQHWKKSAKMMDLLCLLQLIACNPRESRPKLNLDVAGLIQYTVDNWNSF